MSSGLPADIQHCSAVNDLHVNESGENTRFLLLGLWALLRFMPLHRSMEWEIASEGKIVF